LVQVVDGAERAIKAPPRRSQSAPRPQMSAGKIDLDHVAIFAYMPVLHLDVQVRGRAQHRLVIAAHAVETIMALGPGRVVIEPIGPERRHETVEIVGILESDVFVDLPYPPSCSRVHGRSSPRHSALLGPGIPPARGA